MLEGVYSAAVGRRLSGDRCPHTGGDLCRRHRYSGKTGYASADDLACAAGVDIIDAVLDQGICIGTRINSRQLIPGVIRSVPSQVQVMIHGPAVIAIAVRDDYMAPCHPADAQENRKLRIKVAIDH